MAPKDRSGFTWRDWQRLERSCQQVAVLEPKEGESLASAGVRYTMYAGYSAPTPGRLVPLHVTTNTEARGTVTNVVWVDPEKVRLSKQLFCTSCSFLLVQGWIAGCRGLQCSLAGLCMPNTKSVQVGIPEQEAT